MEVNISLQDMWYFFHSCVLIATGFISGMFYGYKVDEAQKFKRTAKEAPWHQGSGSS